MKKLSLFICFCLALGSASAQISQNLSLNEMQIYTKTKTPDKYTGSPYVESDFKRGIIKDEKKNINQPALLRYNAVEDVVEVRLKSGDESMVLPKLTHITYDLGDYYYFIDNISTSNGFIEAYFANYYNGEKARLIARPEPSVTPAQVAKTGYEKDKPANLEVELQYYISINGEPFKPVRLKEKDLEDFFSSDKMEDYFKDNKIKGVEDVVKMLEYYESI